MWQTPQNILWGSTKCCDKYCDVIGSLLQHLSGCWKHKFFFKNCQFFQWKKSWPTFSGNVQHDKCHGKIYKDPEGPLTVVFAQGFFGTSEVVRNKRSEKGYLPVTKGFGPFFLVLSIVTNLTEQFIRVQKLFWMFFVKIQNQEKLFEKSCFSSEKKLVDFISYDRARQTLGNILLGCTKSSANPCAG